MSAFTGRTETVFPETLFAKEEIQKHSLYVNVALGIPQAEPYQYAVPEHLRDKVAPGLRVRVPLRAQSRVGYIVGISRQPEVRNVKPIAEIIDHECLVPEHFLKLCDWIAAFYHCSMGQALETAMPAPFRKGRTTMKSRPRKNSKGEESDALIHATPVHRLTAMQENVLNEIQVQTRAGQYAGFLLHGVTGSGKTEVYLRLIEDLTARGMGAIVLVPEISLTPQTTQRFQSRFGSRVAVVHSRVSAGKRLEEWHRIRKGEARVVVGARSAVFAPVKNLGLIVIDEEHDDSYKQDETPRYETAAVADRRCRLESAVLLRGSATPSLESYYESENGRIRRVELPERIENRPLPEVQVVDMRQERAGKRIRIFSIALEDAIRRATDQKEQVMLLMNRRGFSPFINCPACGSGISCPRCRVSLVYHYDRSKLLCHSCGFSQIPPKICPTCDKGQLRFFGIGTEKVESEASRLFPGARIARMDADTTARKGSHEAILGAFRKREIDILIGTQMIAKGHDFPGVSVIGVISADTALNLPDFRSAERTFDLLTQVAGRAGRNDIPGKVYIQSFLPAHYAVQASKDHDYRRFYNQEIRFREELNSPPFRSAIRIIIAGATEKLVLKKSLEFKKRLELAGRRDLDILGPAPCPISKKFGRFFWNLYLKAADVCATNVFLKDVLQSFDRSGVAITVDVCPR